MSTGGGGVVEVIVTVEVVVATGSLVGPEQATIAREIAMVRAERRGMRER